MYKKNMLIKKLKLLSNYSVIKDKIDTINSLINKEYSIANLSDIVNSVINCTTVANELVDLIPSMNVFQILSILSVDVCDISYIYKTLNLSDKDYLANMLLCKIITKIKEKVTSRVLKNLYKALNQNTLPFEMAFDSDRFVNIYTAFNCYTLDVFLKSDRRFDFMNDDDFINLIKLLKKGLGESIKNQIGIVTDIFNGMNNGNLLYNYQDKYTLQFLPDKDRNQRILYFNDLQKLVRKYGKNSMPLSIIKLLCAVYMTKISNKFSDGEVVSIKENDYIIEANIAYNVFLNNILITNNNSTSVVIGASPFFIYKWYNDRLLKDKNVVFVCPDYEVDFFSTYFKNSAYVGGVRSEIKFMTYMDFVDDFKNSNDYKNILALESNKYINYNIYDLIKSNNNQINTNNDMVILTLGSDSSLDLVLRDSSINSYISNVILLPTGISNSAKSKKKAIWVYDTGNIQNNKITVNTYKVLTKDKCQYVSQKNLYYISSDKYIKKRVTLRQHIYNITYNITDGNIRNPAISVRFSNEIEIWFSSKLGKDNQVRVEAYLTDTVFTSSSEKGKMINETKKIMMVSADEDLTEYVKDNYLTGKIKKGKNPRKIRDILSDIFSKKFHNKDNINNISLRTAWIVNPKCEDDLSAAECTLLKNLMLSPIGEKGINNLLFDEIQGFLSDDGYGFNDSMEECYFVISSVLDYLEKESWIKTNVIEEYFRNEDLEQRHLNQIKGMITKKTFTDKEYVSLISMITNRIYRGNYSYIGSLIGILTGLEKNIICGLSWSDYVEDDIGFYHLQIYRQVSNDGKNYSKFKKIESCRLFPVSYLLSKYLTMKLDNDKKQFGDDYINHRIVDYGKDILTPITLAKMNKELIKKLGIEKEIITIPHNKKGFMEKDINKYKGDIFRSDFIKRCIDAKFSADEICYLIGNKKITTIANYYLDFNDIGVQHKLYKKLERLTAILNNVPNVKLNSGNINEREISEFEVESDTRVQITVDVEPLTEGKTNVFINTDYGFDVEVF